MNCAHCLSKIFESDRCCPQCGAPNDGFPLKKECFGDLMRQIENQKIEMRGGINNQLLYVYYQRIMAGLPARSNY